MHVGDTRPLSMRTSAAATTARAALTRALATAPNPPDTLTAATAIWPPTRHQAKVAARTLTALRAVLGDPGAAGLAPGTHARLVQSCGFALAGARASPDGATVHIAYECAPGRERDTAAALEAAGGSLRSAVARALRTRRVPRLRFARDAPTEEEAAVLDMLDRIERGEV